MMALFAATIVLRADILGTWLAALGILASAGVAVATFLMAMKTRNLVRDVQAEIEIGRSQALLTPRSSSTPPDSRIFLTSYECG